jgi:hypothetical protein
VYELENLSLRQMTTCGTALRTLHQEATSLPDVCERMVRHLYENLRAGDERACVMVRAYRTVNAASLDREQLDFARAAGGASMAPDTKCLTLMASAGDEPAWNDVRQSAGHRAIPLLSPEAVDRLPMVAQLVRQLGLEVDQLLESDPAVIMDMQQQTFNVFHVQDAAGSPFIPAQAGFVDRYGIRSVLGFGSLLPTGDLFAIILFSRAPITRETAQLFRPLALAAKLSILPFESGPQPAVHNG